MVLLFENGDSFRLSYEAVLKSAVRKGDEISQTRLEDLIREDTELRIRNKALKLLQRRSHSVNELKLKLLKKFPDQKNTITNVLAKLEKSGLLDDRAFAMELIESKTRQGKTGIEKLRAILFGKGVNPDIINDSLSRYVAHHDFKEDALKLASKKYELLLRLNLSKEKTKNRLYSFLKSKGFKPDEIYYSLKNLSLLD